MAVQCSTDPGSILLLIIFGGALQVLGILLTALQIAKARMQFGQPHSGDLPSTKQVLARYRRRLFDQIKRLHGKDDPSGPVLLRDSGRTLTEGAGMSDQATASASRQPAADHSLGYQEQLDRIDVLLQYTVNRMDSELSELRREVRSASQKADADIAKLTKQLATTTQDLEGAQSQLQTLATGGLRIQAWNVLLIAGGTVVLVVGAALSLSVPIKCLS